MRRLRVHALALPLLIGGCAAGPDYERPELDVPENYLQPVAQGESFANTPWTMRISDPIASFPPSRSCSHGAADR